jgi:hypothetical protein
MRTSILAATLLLIGCESGDPAGSAPAVSQNILDGLTALREQQNAPPNAFDQELPFELSQRQSWMNCDGYITSNASAGFCEPTVPDTWGPLQFEDKLFFFVPLSG